MDCKKNKMFKANL